MSGSDVIRWDNYGDVCTSTEHRGHPYVAQGWLAHKRSNTRSRSGNYGGCYVTSGRAVYAAWMSRQRDDSHPR